MKVEINEQCTQTDLNENDINLIALEDIKNNIVRKISSFIYNKLSLKTISVHLTKSYRLLHDLFILLSGLIAIFNTSLFHLIILLIIVSLDAISIVVLHECPLTTMERKYLNITSTDIRNEMLKKAGIVYHCGHDYEKQIELLINVWMLIAGKCLVILLLKTFHFKIFNYNNLYIL
jgi:hypothetical protein